MSETKRDESKMGGYFHGPSASPGLTAREYDEMMMEYYRELDDAREDARWS